MLSDPEHHSRDDLPGACGAGTIGAVHRHVVEPNCWRKIDFLIHRPPAAAEFLSVPLLHQTGAGNRGRPESFEAGEQHRQAGHRVAVVKHGGAGPASNQPVAAKCKRSVGFSRLKWFLISFSSARRVRRPSPDGSGSRKHVQDCDAVHLQVPGHQHEQPFHGNQLELQHEAETRARVHRIVGTESGTDWVREVQRVHVDDLPDPDGNHQHQRLADHRRVYEALLRVRGHLAGFRRQRFKRGVRHAEVCEISRHQCGGRCSVRLINYLINKIRHKKIYFESIYNLKSKVKRSSRIRASAGFSQISYRFYPYPYLLYFWLHKQNFSK